jgi:uncharacterized protein
MLYVKEVAGKGRGVFSSNALFRGEYVEVAPIIIIPESTVLIISKTVLNPYCVVWGENREELALVLGYGSLYNHSYTPNMKYVRDLVNKEMRYVALGCIPQNTELTINYNGDPLCKDFLWFEPI